MDRLLILKPPKGTDLEGLSEDDSISWPEYPSTGLTMPEENYGKDSGSTYKEKDFRRISVSVLCIISVMRQGNPYLCWDLTLMIWACHSKYQYIIDDLIQHFHCGKVKQNNFRIVEKK